MDFGVGGGGVCVCVCGGVGGGGGGVGGGGVVVAFPPLHSQDLLPALNLCTALQWVKHCRGIT